MSAVQNIFFFCLNEGKFALMPKTVQEKAKSGKKRGGHDLKRSANLLAFVNVFCLYIHRGNDEELKKKTMRTDVLQATLILFEYQFSFRFFFS